MDRSIRLVHGILFSIFSLALVHASEPDAAKLALFESEIRPLLIEHCLECHGGKKAESGLRLDSFEALLKGGDSGPVVNPGHADVSLLLKAVRREDGLEMPPDRPLADHQIQSIEKWVEAGAVWPEGMRIGSTGGAELRSGPITDAERAFWSFQPISDPAVPESTGDHDFVHPVDRFLQGKLESSGLQMRSPADKVSLLRRATFDLTGLPPRPEEVEAFLADESADAFAKVVERLLASRAYGERWGRHWLDIVRYADTAGETADYPTPLAYKYRNWVIDAFQSDMPYDEFLKLQLAGDLLGQEMIEGLQREPTAEELDRYRQMVIATGFIAISRRFGFDSQNYHHLTIQDTIDTVGQAVIGLTLGCARCHDHKFDPVTAQDYYALYGIFESTKYSFPGSEERQRPADLIPVLPASQAERAKSHFDARLAQLDARLGELNETIQSFKESRVLFDGFESQALNQQVGEPFKSYSQVTVVESGQSPFRNVNPLGTRGVFAAGDNENNAFEFPLGKEHTSESTPVLYYNLDFRNTSAASEFNGAYRMYLGHGPGHSPAVELGVTGRNLAVRNGADFESVADLVENEWYNIQLTLNLGSKTYSGRLTSSHGTIEFFDKSFATQWDGVIDDTFVDRYGYIPGTPPPREFDNLVVSTTQLAPAEHSLDLDSKEVQELRQKKEDYQRLLNERAAATTEKKELTQIGPYEVLYGVMEQPQSVDAVLQLRGEPSKPGAVVARRNLEILGGTPLPDGVGSGRKQLAEWLSDSRNPLTARVMVNRIWQHHFGRGLVSTESDFGFRGEAPSHPELLDWLASRFIESNWSIKQMHRLLMTSAAYQQASSFDQTAAEMDPNNRLLWRFSPRRLSAEEIRDAMLFVSETLDLTVGAEHPFPPTDRWSFSQHGPFYAVYDTPQRSVYQMQQRLKKHPFLGLFDGADTNVSTAHRQLTTVPTQALFLMNNQFVHQCSQDLAKLLVSEYSDDGERVGQLFERSLSRPATSDELQESLQFISEYRSALTELGDANALEKSWAAFIRTVLIRNEFLYLN
ncbi:PSD1 and planctomycete cytochrome C domain-containing protein [Planctomicrobium sp. SH668]|uniref:PSD1 and planctomycete cytochrome C domain-containing protein n=1 Tax=Planctomicrobium sp. SH668 TaxID=3448126 RepID=UPI003F5C5E45